MYTPNDSGTQNDSGTPDARAKGITTEHQLHECS